MIIVAISAVLVLALYGVTAVCGIIGYYGLYHDRAATVSKNKGWTLR